jgi:hypothetical protein
MAKQGGGRRKAERREKEQAAGEGEGGRDGGGGAGDSGILLPIAQGAMSHAWGYLTGRGRNAEVGVRGLLHTRPRSRGA